jgi:hypothetical protein
MDALAAQCIADQCILIESNIGKLYTSGNNIHKCIDILTLSFSKLIADHIIPQKKDICNKLLQQVCAWQKTMSGKLIFDTAEILELSDLYANLLAHCYVSIDNIEEIIQLFHMSSFVDKEICTLVIKISINQKIQGLHNELEQASLTLADLYAKVRAPFQTADIDADLARLAAESQYVPEDAVIVDDTRVTHDISCTIDYIQGKIEYIKQSIRDCDSDYDSDYDSDNDMNKLIKYIDEWISKWWLYNSKTYDKLMVVLKVPRIYMCISQCIICYGMHQYMVFLECKHILCIECMYKYKYTYVCKNKKECPYCRQQMIFRGYMLSQ